MGFVCRQATSDSRNQNPFGCVGNPPEPTREPRSTKEAKPPKKLLPQDLLLALPMIDQSCKHKQKIGKAVYIFNDSGTDVNYFRKPNNPALGPAANSTSHVKQRAGVTAARKYKVTERRQFRFKSVNRILQALDPRWRQLKLTAVALLEFGVGELGADSE